MSATSRGRSATINSPRRFDRRKANPDRGDRAAGSSPDWGHGTSRLHVQVHKFRVADHSELATLLYTAPSRRIYPALPSKCQLRAFPGKMT